MKKKEFSVVVPATTANLGPGFDSVGIALSEYMTVEVRSSNEWNVIYRESIFQDLATDQTNLIIQTMMNVAQRYQRQMNPQQLLISSSIPLGKGFGSSASAIAAGIVIADELLSLQLSDEQKVLLGCLYEGHADNVSAALLGGIVVNYFDGKTVDYLHVTEADVAFVALIPPKILKTTESRGLLPAILPHKEAVRSSTANGLLTAALIQNNWQLVGKMMEKDLLHERFRKTILPYFDDIRRVSKRIDAYGMSISGAGPSLMIAVKRGEEGNVEECLTEMFPYYEGMILYPSLQGAVVSRK